MIRQKQNMRFAILVLLTLGGLGISACGSDSSSDIAPTATLQPVATPTSSIPAPIPSLFITPVFQPNGNRLAQGSGLATGFIQDVPTKDIELGGTPTWITGTSTPEGDVWVVALDDGSTQAYQIPIGAPPRPLEIGSKRLEPDQPPVLAVQSSSVNVATTPANASANSVPVHLAGQRIAYIDNLQRLTVLEPDGSLWRPDIEVLPDSRLLQLSEEQIIVLAKPTSRHSYSALGDDLESTALVVVTVGSNEVSPIYTSGEAVIESLAPVLADINGDGVDEVSLTVSDDTNSWSVVVSTTGEGELARSQPTDRLLGWRYIFAVGPLGPNGQTQLAEMLYPSGQGSLSFLQRQGQNLNVVASLRGYRSHEFGSRNLEQALAADVDRDGLIEVIAPTFDRQHIAGIGHRPEGATEIWRRSIGGTLATNIAVIERLDGTVSLAAATSQGSLRIWQ